MHSDLSNCVITEKIYTYTAALMRTVLAWARLFSNRSLLAQCISNKNPPPKTCPIRPSCMKAGLYNTYIHTHIHVCYCLGTLPDRLGSQYLPTAIKCQNCTLSLHIINQKKSAHLLNPIKKTSSMIKPL